MSESSPMVTKARSVVCAGRRRDGQPCRASATIGGYCIGHAPDLEGKRREARQQGGHNKAKAARLSKLMPIRLVPIFERLETALTELHTGSLEPRVASSMAALASALIRCVQAGEMEIRLRDLEAKAQASANGRRGSR